MSASANKAQSATIGNQSTDSTTKTKVTKDQAIKKAKTAISSKVARERAKAGESLTNLVDSKGRSFLLKEVQTSLAGEVIAVRRMAVREDNLGVRSFLDAVQEKKSFENGAYRLFFREGIAWVSIGGKKPILYTMLSNSDLCALLAY